MDANGLTEELDISNEKPDILLNKYDLITDPDGNFFTKMSKEDFMTVYEDPPRVQRLCSSDGELCRYAIVLPLYPEGCDHVIPIPFIIDTGAPGYVRLCVGAIDKLREAGAIREKYNSVSGSMSKLKGSLVWGEKSIAEPVVGCLPKQYELTQSLEGDPRGNLLGILAIEHFQLMADCTNSNKQSSPIPSHTPSPTPSPSPTSSSSCSIL